MASTFRYEHHGTEVVVQQHLKGKHREHCLCYQDCLHFRPGRPEENCKIANLVFAVCLAHNVVLPVWECPLFFRKGG